MSELVLGSSISVRGVHGIGSTWGPRVVGYVAHRPRAVDVRYAILFNVSWFLFILGAEH